MLVVDDAQHADDASLRLMHYLARTTASDRVLLVLAHRPSSDAGLGQVRRSLLGRRAAITLDLKPLPHSDVSTLVRQLRPEATDEFIDAVWTASEGVPFAVVELTRTVELARTGSVHDPLSADWLLAADLTDEQAQTLAAAAVIGSTFDTDEFLGMAGLPEGPAYAVLEAGISKRLLLRTDTGYQFRHTLLRDALLARVLPTQLRGLHLRAAAALTGLDRSPARIGHHLIKADDARASTAPGVCCVRPRRRRRWAPTKTPSRR